MTGGTADTAVISDTAAPPGTAATAPGSSSSANKPGGNPVSQVLELFKSLHVRKPGADGTGSGAAADKAATLSEVAGILTTLTKDHLGSLLVHPGHATVGVYYLARRHEMSRAADHIDGSKVGDQALVEKLLKVVDISDSIYPDRYPILVKQQQVVKEGDILYFYKQFHKLQPGYYVAVDKAAKKLLWVIRGTHDIHDMLTDLCGIATPLPTTPYGPGAAAHWGMWRAAGWLLDTQWQQHVLAQLKAHPGFDLEIIGHSMGGGVGALLALRLNTEDKFKQQRGGVKVTCIGVASAACLNGELATACAPYTTTLVMRNDLVPRFSTAAVEAMQAELFEINYKHLAHQDLMEHEVYRTAVRHAATAAEKVRANPLACKAASATTSTLAQLQAKAAGAGQAVASQLDAAVAAGAPAEGGGAASKAKGPAALLQDDKVRGAVSWVSHMLKEAAGGKPGPKAAAGSSSSQPHPLESFDDAGEAQEAAAAAAAGDLVNVQLYAPGRLLYVKPIDGTLPDEQQRFELVDGGADQRFKRIVLRSSCMADHLPTAYKHGLTDVLASVSAKQQAS